MPPRPDDNHLHWALATLDELDAKLRAEATTPLSKQTGELLDSSDSAAPNAATQSQSSYRKFQVFISSTYVDLLTERQTAVTGILESGHIPAGMELFAAGDEEQLAVIRRWIDRSDVFLLILGRRYGSIEGKTGKSYVQLEYEYAVSKRKPFFALVLSDTFVNDKIRSGESIDAVTELNFPEQFKSFKSVVTSRLCTIVNEHKDIRLAIVRYGKCYSATRRSR